MIDLKRFLFEANINQSELSKLLGVTPQAITNLKQGKMQVPDDWYIIIKEKLNLNLVDYINQPKKVKKYTSNIEVLNKDVRFVPLINRYAYASYSENWNDNEFLESMELLPTFHQEDGNYLWFEIKGDSMTRNDDPSLNEGDYVLGRELYNHHWMNLQLRRAKIWVINHRVQGLMVKEVVRQYQNIITCHSWNPIVAPFDLDLNEVNQLFYIKEVRKTNFF